MRIEKSITHCYPQRDYTLIDREPFTLLPRKTYNMNYYSNYYEGTGKEMFNPPLREGWLVINGQSFIGRI